MGRRKDDNEMQRQRASGKPHPYKKAARAVRKAGSEDVAESEGPRRIRKPVAHMATLPTVGSSVYGIPPRRGEIALSPAQEIRLVVGELRFPAPPSVRREKVVSAFRAHYPGESFHGGAHVAFASPDGGSTVRIAATSDQWAIGLETRDFSDFWDFGQRLSALLEPLKRSLSVLRYSRVGVRSVFAMTEPEDWRGQPFGQVVRHTLEGFQDPVRYRLRNVLDEGGKARRFCDFDVFAEDVASPDLEGHLDLLLRVSSQMAKGEGLALDRAAGGFQLKRSRRTAALSGPAIATPVIAYPDLVPPSETDLLTAELLEERGDLLDRKYSAAGVSPREQQRLARVTKALDELLPTVSVEQFEQLEEMARRSRAIKERSLQIRQRFGQPAP